MPPASKPPAKAPPAPPTRDEQGRLLPGATLNPGGRPKGLAAKCREVCDDINILGLLALTATGADGAKHRERLEARKILLDRAWGRAIDTQVNVTSEPGSELADAALEQLARALATPQATVTPLVDTNAADPLKSAG